MASLTTSLNSDFTPAAGSFIVQVDGGRAYLWRKNSSSTAFSVVDGSPISGAVIVDNPVAGAIYQLRSNDSVTVAVDQ